MTYNEKNPLDFGKSINHEDNPNDSYIFSQVHSLKFFLFLLNYGGLGFGVLDWVFGVGVFS